MSMPPNPQYSSYGGGPIPPALVAPKKKANPLLIGCLGCGGIAALVLIIAAIVGVASGGAGKPNTVTSHASSASQGTELHKPAKHAAGIGDEVRDGKFAFAVTKVRTGITHVGDEYVGQDAQGQYVEIYVRVSNIADKPQTFFGANQKLFVGKQQYDADDTASMLLPNSKSLIEPINPGNAVSGIIVFDLPRKATPTKIEFHDSAFSGGATVLLRK